MGTGAAVVVAVGAVTAHGELHSVLLFPQLIHGFRVLVRHLRWVYVRIYTHTYARVRTCIYARTFVHKHSGVRVNAGRAYIVGDLTCSCVYMQV